MGACMQRLPTEETRGTERRPTASLQHMAQQRCAGRLFAAHPGTRGSSQGPGGRRLWSRGRTRGSAPGGRDGEQQRPWWRQPQQAYSALPITQLGGVRCRSGPHELCGHYSMCGAAEGAAPGPRQLLPAAEGGSGGNRRPTRGTHHGALGLPFRQLPVVRLSVGHRPRRRQARVARGLRRGAQRRAQERHQ